MEPTHAKDTSQTLPRIPASVMEGLFVRGLHAEGKLAEGLLDLGYDMRKPELNYPVLTWQRGVNLARQELFGHLSDEEAYRLLGRKLITGFLETLVGRVVAVAMPMIGPARVVDRVPRYLAMMGRAELEVTMTPVTERSRRIYLPDRYNRPEFIAGALEVGLEHANAPQALVTVEERSPEGYRLFLRW